MKFLRFNGKIIIAFKNRSIVLEPISRAKFPLYTMPDEICEPELDQGGLETTQITGREEMYDTL